MAGREADCCADALVDVDPQMQSEDDDGDEGAGELGDLDPVVPTVGAN
jgi:hypothetical protein